MNKINNQRNNQFNLNIQKEDINIVRQDFKLSLRKNKLDKILMKKRNFNNKNNEIYIDYEYICKYLPEILINEFDNYDDKLEVINNFLKGDFSCLKGLNYSIDNVIYFCLSKLEDISFDLNIEELSSKYKEYIESISYSLIDYIMKTIDLKIIYSATMILINFISDKENLIRNIILKDERFIKKLSEIYYMENRLINNNIIWLIKNLINTSKIYDEITKMINYNNILFDYFEYNANNINNIELVYDDINVNCDIIRKLLKIDKKNFPEKLSFIYPSLIKIFQNITSLIINKTYTHTFFSVIELLDTILYNIGEIIPLTTEKSTYLNLFLSESFTVTLCNLIKKIIPYVINGDITFLFLKQLIFIPGSLFTCTLSEHFELYKKQGFISILEEIMNISNKPLSLVNKIEFVISNYVIDYIDNSIEVTLNSNILILISDYLNNEIKDNNLNYEACEESFYCFYNCFAFGDRKVKKEIIKLYKNISIYSINEIYEDNNLFINQVEFIVEMVNFLRISMTNLNELENLIKEIKEKGLIDIINKVESNYKNEKDLLILDKFKKIFK